MEEQTNDDGILAGTSPRKKKGPKFTTLMNSKRQVTTIWMFWNQRQICHWDESTNTIASTDVITCVICERRFQGARGVIHQAKTKCGESLNRLFSDSNSEHDDGLVNSHNANRTLSETHDKRILQKGERRPLVKWPKMTNTSEWTDFDEDAASNVKMLMHGTIEHI